MRAEKFLIIVDFSIVIVNFSAWDHLRTCLGSICRLFDGGSFEIIVVDNASQDQSIERIRESYPEVRLIANRSNIGYSTAINQAVETARGRYLFLLHPDTVLVDGGFRSLLDYLEQRPEVAVVGLRQVNAGLEPIPCYSPDRCLKDRKRTLFLSSLYLTRFRDRKSEKPVVPVRVGYVNLAAAVARREAMISVGGLDGRFFFMVEELDLGFRVNAAGYQVHFFPGLRVIHRGPPEVLTLYRLLQYHQGDIKLFQKHGASVLTVTCARVLWLLSRSCCALASCLFSSEKRGQSRRALGIFLRALVWHVSGRRVTFGLHIE